jgi:hypothetical protein
MVQRAAGTILLTGASASVKGYPQSAVFAMGKFALRGLAQSMARELAPKGIHVAHFVIDGGVRNAEKGRVEGGNMAADSYPTRSLRAICTWSSSPAAPGRGRWSCAPGSSGSEAAALLRAPQREARSSGHSRESIVRSHACVAEMAGSGFFAASEPLFSCRISGLEIENQLSTPRDNVGARYAYRASRGEPAALKQFKQLAAALGVSQKALIAEGLNHVLAKYGKPTGRRRRRRPCAKMVLSTP